MLARTIKRAFSALGLDVRRHPPRVNHRYSGDVTGGLTKIHYGCGTVLLPGWLNTDLHPPVRDGFRTLRLNLLEPHPFPDATFEFAFCEDLLEHLPQGDQILFLTEVHRTLKAGGVARIACPCLEGVLAIHYPQPGYATALQAKSDCYEQHGHHHFMCKPELEMVARTLGFSRVTFCEYGQSAHPALQNLELREGQKANFHAELTK